MSIAQFLLVICLAALLLAVFVSRDNSPVKAKDDLCPSLNPVDSLELYRSNDSLFSELNQPEVKSIVQFLFSQRHLNLTAFDSAVIASNYIHLIERLLPPKKAVLAYLEGRGPKPARMARVFIFKGAAADKVVEEYLVGPLPNPTQLSLIKSEGRKTSIPFTNRPYSSIELKAFVKTCLPRVAGITDRLLRESYGASLSNCGQQCLKFLIMPVTSAFLEPGRRKSWVWFAYDIEFYTLHPLDFEFLVDMTDVDPAEWQVQKIFYANQFFDSLDELMLKYNSGLINKTRINFPEHGEREYGAVKLRGEPVPRDLKPPPQQVQPSGPRHSISGSRVQYMDWGFNVRISPTQGAQLLDVRYKGERIVYELSLQEVAVLYSGHSPASSVLYFADSAALFGARMRGLMPGVDCPDYATMLDALVYSSNDRGMARLQNSLCIFEHSTDTPLRRHRAYGLTGAFYNGLVDQVLILRMLISIINYDYVFDYIFHNNGALEVKVSATGYLTTSFYFPEEEPYGTRISRTVVAGLHHHLFHFKADIDVKGTANRYRTLDIGSELKHKPWSDNSAHTQNVLTKQEKRTEREALYSHNFNHPKYLVFYTDQDSALGNSPGYRIIHKGLTKTLLPEGDGFERSVSWAQHQMAVTRQKDQEMSSSSIFAMWDSSDPVVNFRNFWQDDESIVDEVSQTRGVVFTLVYICIG